MPKRGGKKKYRDKTNKFPDLNISGKGQLPSRKQLLEQVNYLECHPSFCFEYFDKKHKKYSARRITNCAVFHKLFDHFNKLCQMTWRQIEQSGSYHAHEIIWSKTNQKHGFSKGLGAKPQQFPPYQFQVFDEFRVIGFHEGNIFHIVWFDRNHEVYG